MGTRFVKTLKEMNMQNRLFYREVKSMQNRTISVLSKINKTVSKDLLKLVKFKGTLLSNLNIESPSSSIFKLISSTDHSFSIEKGEPPQIGRISFKSNPLLEEWVRTKLSVIDKDKADFFIRKGWVLVGMHGFPFDMPKGLRFMEKGFNIAFSQAKPIIDQGIQRIKQK